MTIETGSPYCNGCHKLITRTGGVDSLVACCSHQNYDDGTFNGGYCKQCCPAHGGRETMDEKTDDTDALQRALGFVSSARRSVRQPNDTAAQVYAQLAISEALIDIAESLRTIERRYERQAGEAN